MFRIRGRLLVDSDVIINYLRQTSDTVQLIDTLHANGRRFACSTITVLEVLRGMRKHEQTVTVKLLDSMHHYPVTDAVVQTAWKLFRKRRVHGTTLPFLDSIIAATALTEKLSLLTYNSKDYPPDILYEAS
ncbi:MAG TPA: hypothetical protein DEG44_04515 [Candidatus Kerfeldbacteria bacterium]|nr:hypothetical protein [Candidatus Kerfeldbacteria bacterium]